MRCWPAVLVATLLLAGCGGDDDADAPASAGATVTSTAPALTGTAPQPTRRDRISSCLTGLGYRLTGGATGSTDTDTADYQIVFEGPRGGGYIGFYKSATRAARVVKQLRQTASRVDGAAAERHGAVNIVWVDLPGQPARASVRSCLTV